MCCDNVRVFREVFAVLQFSLEVGALRAHFADGLDGDSLAVRPVVGDPCGAVGPLAGLFDEGESLVQARLVGGRLDNRHCSRWFKLALLFERAKSRAISSCLSFSAQYGTRSENEGKILFVVTANWPQLL